MKAEKFDYALNGWDTSNVGDMSSMFRDTRDFNQFHGSWDSSNVTDMSRMFENANKYNQYITGMNVENVKHMNRMFKGASSYNQWMGCCFDPKSAIDLGSMFEDATSFNQDVEFWDVSKAKFLDRVFRGASKLNKNYCEWGERLSNAEVVSEMFTGTLCDDPDDPDLGAPVPGPFCRVCSA